MLGAGLSIFHRNLLLRTGGDEYRLMTNSSCSNLLTMYLLWAMRRPDIMVTPVRFLISQHGPREVAAGLD